MLTNQTLCMALLGAVSVTVCICSPIGISDSEEQNEVNATPKARIWNKDWCLLKPFNQTIKHSKCIPKIIPNNFCYGQCNSLYIPNDQSPFQQCKKCQPSASRWVVVTLDCPLSYRKPKRLMTIQLVESCQCQHCNSLIR